MTLTKSPNIRNDMIKDAIDQYLSASPARVAEVEALVAQVDTMVGPGSQWARISAHFRLLNSRKKSLTCSAYV